jgi:hypothetical protein
MPSMLAEQLCGAGVADAVAAWFPACVRAHSQGTRIPSQTARNSNCAQFAVFGDSRSSSFPDGAANSLRRRSAVCGASGERLATVFEVAVAKRDATSRQFVVRSARRAGAVDNSKTMRGEYAKTPSC